MLAIKLTLAVNKENFYCALLGQSARQQEIRLYKDYYTLILCEVFLEDFKIKSCPSSKIEISCSRAL